MVIFTTSIMFIAVMNVTFFVSSKRKIFAYMNKSQRKVNRDGVDNNGNC